MPTRPGNVYLDHNATSPIDPRVLEAMRPHWLAAGNSESRHAAGRAARRSLERARELVAQVLGAEPDEVCFTSGGTEANNLALFGLAGTLSAGPRTIVTSPIEHPAVSEVLEQLRARGWTLVRLPVDRTGRVDLAMLRSGWPPDTRLATLMLANNETGALQPVAEVAELASKQGIALHTDAVQAVGRIPVDFHGLGVTTLAASAHKFHGPTGVGVLLVRRGTRLEPHLLGGGQEGGRRPGTVSVALCVGLATALELWQAERETRRSRWCSLRDQLARGLIRALGPSSVVVHGPSEPSLHLPQTLDVSFAGLDGDALLMQLDLAGVCASIGSACASGATRPSATLEAMGVPTDLLRSSIRFSFGATTTEAEIDEALVRIITVVERARRDGF